MILFHSFDQAHSIDSPVCKTERNPLITDINAHFQQVLNYKDDKTKNPDQQNRIPVNTMHASDNDTVFWLDVQHPVLAQQGGGAQGSHTGDSELDSRPRAKEPSA